jgi:hypothetical protein
MPYAADGQISHAPIDGGIEISEQEYQQALAGMQDGEHVQIINGGLFVGPLPEPEPEPEPEGPPDWPAVIAERRWEVEVGGITINGMRVETDDRSKLLINGAAVEAMLDPAYVLKWKAAGGFIELEAPQVLTVARAVRAHVQACFDREAELLGELEAGTFTEAMLDQGWSNESVPEPAAG